MSVSKWRRAPLNLLRLVFEKRLCQGGVRQARHGQGGFGQGGRREGGRCDLGGRREGGRLCGTRLLAPHAP